jgi:hypothetical protein
VQSTNPPALSPHHHRVHTDLTVTTIITIIDYHRTCPIPSAVIPHNNQVIRH